MKTATRIAFRALALVALCASCALLAPTHAQTARVVATTTQNISDPFMALPESEMIMVIDLQRIMNDAVPRVLASNPALLTKMTDGLEQMKALTGIDFRAPTRLIVGVPSLDATPKGGQFKAVMVAQVNDADKLMSLMLLALREKGTPGATGIKLVEQQYEGETLYVLPKGNLPKDLAGRARKIDFDLTLTALDAGTILLGSPAEVRAGIDASAGRRARANADLVAAATRHPNALFGLAMTVPPSLTSSLLNDGKQGESGGGSDNEIKRAISSIRQVSAALGLTPAGFDVLLAGRATTNEEAKNIGDMLTGLRALATLEPPKDAQQRMLQNAIKSVQILTEGNELQLRTEFTREMIEAFVQEVKKEMDKATPPPPPVKTPVRRPKRIRRGARA